MQGVALVGVFLRVSPFAAEARLDRDDCSAAVGERLGRFFGKRGRAVIDANLELVAAAYDGLIDVSAAPRSAGRDRAAVTVIPTSRQPDRSTVMNARETSIERPITVGDLMALEPIVIAHDRVADDAARLMDEYDISGLPVVGAGGDVVGVHQPDRPRPRPSDRVVVGQLDGLEVRI
jgi:hypothetical protein